MLTVDDLAKLLALLDPRVVSAINLVAIGYVLREMTKYRQERISALVRDASEQGNDKVRDDRVTQLATSLGSFASKVDSLHARLDVMDKNNVIEMTKLTTELHFRLAAIDKRLGSSTDTTSLS